MKNNDFVRRLVVFIGLLLLGSGFCCSQNDVMLQAFFWNVPTDTINKQAIWWDILKMQTGELKEAGFTALWVPPPTKGVLGINDVGYGIYDHYDLGYYNQKGSVETRYGSKNELMQFLATAHAPPSIDVYADIIMTHVSGTLGDSAGVNNEEINPAVKSFIRGEAHHGAYFSYNNSNVRWVIPNANPGDYFIQIKGYNLPWDSPVYERGYNLTLSWQNTRINDSILWEQEPNNGSGNYTIIPGSGFTIRGFADYQGDIDEYKVHLNNKSTIMMSLQAMRQNGVQWQPADQTLGYYPVSVWYNGQDISRDKLEARTATRSTYPDHVGTGEANYQWSYLDFHPVDSLDWVEKNYETDSIFPHQHYLNYEFNTGNFSDRLLPRLQAWGEWMIKTIGFDGFKLNFIWEGQVDFWARWMGCLPKVNNNKRPFLIGDDPAGKSARIKQWVDGTLTNSPDTLTLSVFDYPLRNELQRMCNDSLGVYNMSWLNHAGLIRNLYNSLPGAEVCTFVENHQLAKNSGQWVKKDWRMAYAYILTHEGRPCVFYNHYFGVPEQDFDNQNPLSKVFPLATLQTDIKKLIFIRKTYLGGMISVLSEDGNPSPVNDAWNVYVARRGGNGTKNGAIVVINSHKFEDKGLWVNTSPGEWSNWAQQWLINAFDPSEKELIQPDGRVWVHAPARGYAVYVLESDYVAY